MPRPVDGRAPYLPGLDGIRAIAVAAVVAFHVGVPWLPGGLLGVSMFFTLSGFLITSILLRAWDQTGGFELRRFYLHRARRLLPALVLVLVTVLGVAWVADRTTFATRWQETLAAVFYVSNWQTIAQGQSYLDFFAGPQPLSHLWSLAVEEQFYLVWPLLLLVMMRFLRGDRRAVAGLTVGLALVSFLLLAMHTAPGLDHTRSYEGTDTRAGELLVGAVLALWLRPARLQRPFTRARRLRMNLAGLAGVAVVGVMLVTSDYYALWLYRGGLLVFSVAMAVVIASVVYPGSVLGRALGVTPLRWVGERSYGIYLWHMPVLAFVPAAAADGFSWRLATVQVGLTVLLAAASWAWVEDPIRTHGLRHAFRLPRLELADLRPGRQATTAAVGCVAVLAVGCGTLSATKTVAPRSATTAAASPADLDMPPIPDDATAAAGPSGPHVPAPAAGASGGRDQVTAPSTGTGVAGTKVAGAEAVAVETSCDAVVHVGDSTSVGLVNAAYLPQGRWRIPSQYRRVGVERPDTDISGARSIVETYHDEPNAETAVAGRVDDGYDGCWVLAMGTNDTANQYVGGVYPLAERIDKVMGHLDAQPVLWLTVRTLLSSGPWAEQNMQDWNAALRDACERYPNMRVYDWASEVQDSWYVPDGIHFTSAGYRERAHRIADALATAFPAVGTPPASCLVGSGDR
ncbi:acyltransferase family protein [Nocardioides taihuensis]|uniref:Acyltransferase family protein n=1 Tax=Nocardioides taihuensis TaxID=1835606 RepID=A0ABW0BNH3_9ACTN